MAKILVLDDAAANLDAAREQLVGHELTVVSEFSEARKLLRPRWDEAAKAMVPGEQFDIVLTDLFLPAEREGQGHKGLVFIDELMPTGMALALLALKVGVPKTALVSNGNHHDHPVTWALDSLQNREDGKPFSSEVNTVLPGRLYSFTGYECPTVAGRPEHEGKSYEERAPLFGIKDWARVVAEITKT